jgi:hypothetical protein
MVAHSSEHVQPFSCIQVSERGGHERHHRCASSRLYRIVRQIDIDAPADRLRELIARPGWYVNDGTAEVEPDLRDKGDVAVVRHAALGEFRFRTVQLDRRRSAAFRWIGTRSATRPHPPPWSSSGSTNAMAAG